MKLFNLIRNENMKIYRRLSTWILIGLLVLSVVAVGLVNSFLNDSTPDEWKAGLAEQNAQYEATMKNSAMMPKAAVDQLERNIAINEYRLEHDIAPLNSKSLYGTMNDASGLVSLITLFTIIIAAGMVAGEFSWGTIKLLLIRPVSRSKILVSKYLSALLFALTLLVLHYILSFLVGGIFFGFGDLSQPYLSFKDGQVVEQSMPLHLLSLYGFKSVDLIMMVTFAFMLSSVFRSSSLAIGLSIFLMFTGGQLVMLLSRYEWVKYILFANTNLMQYIDGRPVVEGMTMTFSIVVLIVYFIIFNAFSWFIFNKRDVAA